jgi:CheY-like chemotaxis protein
VRVVLPRTPSSCARASPDPRRGRLRGRGPGRNADELMLKVRSYSPDVAIVDIRMPPTHTTRASARRRRSARSTRPCGVLVLSQYVEPTYAMELLAESAEGVGYLLKDRVSDVTSSRTPCAASARAARPSTRRSSRSSSGAAARRPARPLTRAEREVLGSWPRAARTRRSPSARRHRARRREARDEHLLEAAPPAASEDTAACSPFSPTSCS